jgi:hypothetical protein
MWIFLTAIIAAIGAVMGRPLVYLLWGVYVVSVK